MTSTEAFPAAADATAHASLQSKVLVLDTDAACRATVGAFCLRSRLQAHKVRADTILAVLRSNVDLGAIFLCDRIGEAVGAGRTLGRELHVLRPDLPLFLRCEDEAAIRSLSREDSACFSAVYTAADIESLVPVVQRSIFSLVYPAALVRGITEISQSSFASQFRGMQLDIDPPYIVRDRLIFGEVFTLIPIESRWCRGFMMLQSEAASLQRLESSHTHMDAADADDFRNLNGLLSELTNLIWGAFKNRYGGHEPRDMVASQVPIVVNNLHRYISFGSSDPQLGLRCTLSAPGIEPVEIYQRFVFSLNWSPEDFRENDADTDNLLASGELELF